MKYSLQCIAHDGSVTTKIFEKETLTGVLQEVKFFLLGCGFVIKGEIDEVPTEDY